MRLTVTHTLTCSLPSPARAVEHVLLTPLTTPQQRVERWSIEMPGFAEAATFRDGFGNRAHLVSQTRPGDTLVVTVSGIVETTDRAGVLGRLEFDPPAAIFRRQTGQAKPDAALTADIDPSAGRIGALHEIMRRVHETTGMRQTQSGEGQQQSMGSASAPELAQSFIAAARALEIPARYVTGYLFDEDDGAAFHAWAEALDEGLGWIGFDPLLNLCPTDRHIRVASGLDVTGTMPLRTVPAWPEMPVETVAITAA